MTDDFTDFIARKTIDYLSVPAVVGHEGPFFSHLEHEYAGAGLNVLRHNGLLEVHGDKPDSAIVCAHVDRHGLISIGGGEYAYAAQYIKEIRHGENNRASQKEIASITKRFEGERVYAYHPETGVNMGNGVIRLCDPWLLKGDALFAIEGISGAGLGVPVAYVNEGCVVDGALKGQIDNTVSLAVIRGLFARGFAGTALLSAEEEIGKSWAHLADWLGRNGVVTKNLLVIDTSPYTDSAAVDQGALVFRNRDMSALFNADMNDRFRARSRALGIPFQFKDEVLIAKGKTVDQLGSTELGRLIKNTQGRWGGATVQIPTLMYHTCRETTSLRALGHYAAFLHDILIANPMDFTIEMGRA